MMVALPVEGGKGDYSFHNLHLTCIDILESISVHCS